MPARAPSSTRTLLFQGLIDEPHYLLDGTGHLPGLDLNVALFAWNSVVQFRWDAFRPDEEIPHDLSAQACRASPAISCCPAPPTCLTGFNPSGFAVIAAMTIARPHREHQHKVGSAGLPACARG